LDLVAIGVDRANCAMTADRRGMVEGRVDTARLPPLRQGRSVSLRRTVLVETFTSTAILQNPHPGVPSEHKCALSVLIYIGPAMGARRGSVLFRLRLLILG